MTHRPLSGTTCVSLTIALAVLAIGRPLAESPLLAPARVYVSVADNKGKPIPGLTVADFQDVILVNQVGERFWDETDESMAFHQEWDFDPSTIESTVTWWHGDDDKNAPLSAARRVASRIPRCTLNVWHDLGDNGVRWFNELNELYRRSNAGVTAAQSTGRKTATSCAAARRPAITP